MPAFTVAFAGGGFSDGSAHTTDGYGGDALWLPPDVHPDEDAVGDIVAGTPAGGDLYKALDRWLYKVPGGLVLSNLGACVIFAGMTAAYAQNAEIKRGQYLVTFGGCNDCHTPGHFFGKPDKARILGGSEVGFEIPNLGTFYGPNLTPDPETGLGKWSAEEIVKAIKTG